MMDARDRQVARETVRRPADCSHCNPRQAPTPEIEYALMIDWEDGQPAEYVPAKSVEHAEQMARTIYAGRGNKWTVGREVNPWRYVRRAHAELTEVVAR